jgi:hypothetical protein
VLKEAKEECARRKESTALLMLKNVFVSAPVMEGLSIGESSLWLGYITLIISGN